jgi:uncharacterized membrane protein
MKPARIEALADGIFAIVMTILVLELRVPTSENVGQELLLLMPKFLAFVISFTIVAIYWTSHHIQFTKIKSSDFNHLWLNVGFLMAVCLIPFSTALLGEHPFNQTAQFFYAINLVACSLVMYRTWNYAIFNNRLTGDTPISDELRYNARQKMLMPSLIYLVALALSYYSTTMSLMLFVLGPIIYFIPVTTRAWEIIADPLGRAGLNK